MQLRWGKGIGISFRDEPEYYLCLGYLANQARHGIDIYTHSNDSSGAWAGQGKLQISPAGCRGLPRALQDAFNKSGDNRLSVSDYVKNLVNRHAFDGWRDPTGNKYTFYRFPISKENVRATVPNKYLKEFDSGFDLS